jgi:hypothetical protein
MRGLRIPDTGQQDEQCNIHDIIIGHTPKLNTATNCPAPRAGYGLYAHRLSQGLTVAALGTKQVQAPVKSNAIEAPDGYRTRIFDLGSAMCSRQQYAIP